MARAESREFRPDFLPGRASAGARAAGRAIAGTVAMDALDGSDSLPRVCHLTIAWARIFPKGAGARPDAQGLGQLSRLVDQLLAQGLQPWATLQQGELPQALQDQGGWLKRSTIGVFADFARLMGEQLGDRISHWITHQNPGREAWQVLGLQNQALAQAPAQAQAQAQGKAPRALHTALQIGHHRMVSHGEALRAIRSAAPGAHIGISLRLPARRAMGPAGQRSAELAADRHRDGLLTRWWLDPLFGRGYPVDLLQALGADAPTVLPGDLRSMASPCGFLGLQIEQRPGAFDGPELAIGHGAAADQAQLEGLQRDYAPPALYLIAADAGARSSAAQFEPSRPDDDSPRAIFLRTERVSF